MKDKVELWNKLLIKAGIKPLEVPREKSTPDDMLVGMNWIKDVFLAQYDKLLAARALVTEDQWASYEMLYTEEEMIDFQEVIIWNRVRYEARLILRARPTIFRKPNKKKKIKNETEQTPDASIRSVAGN